MMWKDRLLISFLGSIDRTMVSNDSSASGMSVLELLLAFTMLMVFTGVVAVVMVIVIVAVAMIVVCGVGKRSAGHKCHNCCH